MKSKPTRCTWKNSLEKDFLSRLSLETNKISNIPLGNESGTNFWSEIEHTLGEIQNAFIRSAGGVLRKKIFKTGKKHFKSLPHKKWFNLNYKQWRTNLQRLGRKLSKTLKNTYLREQFFKLKSKYWSTCRKENRKFEQSILQKFGTLQFSINGDLWDLLKHMKGKIIDKKFNNIALPPIQDLSKHYKRIITKET